MHCADTYTLTVVSHLRTGDAEAIGGAVARELAAVAECEAPVDRSAREVRAR